MTLAAALAIVLLAAAGVSQTKSTSTDWAALVEKAHEHRKVMIRRAVARKIAGAGDAAIAAVRAYEKKNGRSAIALELITAYARSTVGGPTTLALLEEWARDLDFYWRSQALQTLANRRLPRFRSLFESRLSDPSYLTRIQAGRGLCRLGVGRDKVLSLLRDQNPMVRVRIAVCLVEEKDDSGLPTLVEALRQEGRFFDYPWGQLSARTAYLTLRKIAGQEFGFQVGESAAKNAAAIDRFGEFAKRRLGSKLIAPLQAFQDTRKYLGGVSVRSCRNGDLFVRLTTDHRVVFGLEAHTDVKLSRDAFQSVIAAIPAAAEGVHGRVICDYLRIMWKNPTVNQKFAPGHMGIKPTDWLEKLAAALEENGRGDLASQIQSRLNQFLKPRMP